MYLVALDRFLEILYVFAPASAVRNIAYPHAWMRLDRVELEELYLEYSDYRVIYKELTSPVFEKQETEPSMRNISL